MGSPRRKKLQGPWALRYEVLQALGSGGAGDVYLAKDAERGGEWVALKLLDRKRLRESAIADSLRNEFTSLTRLSHPHLAKVWDFGSSREEMYLSTEYVEGSDLISACRNADLNTVLRRIVELLRGLDYLHRRGVLHLDLKPDNILVAKPKVGAGGVKVIDFGLAQWTLKNPEIATEFSGSPPYSAPELMLTGHTTPASDLYAVGMMFYQLFSAGLPFASEDPLQRMQEQLYGSLPPPRQLNPALPEAFGSLMQRLIERDPQKRPASAGELLGEINAALGENYSLRSAVAPAQILEESDRLFFPECLETLLAASQDQANAKMLLLGRAGGGKSRLLRHLKERLQLSGGQPAFFSDLALLDPELRPEKINDPLLIDLKEVNPEEWKALRAFASSSPTPLFVSLEKDPGAAPEFQRLEIPALDAQRLQKFLSEEIRGFPANLAESLAKESSESLLQLEDLLQELRERHAIAWTDEGWRWNELQSEKDFSKLTENSHQRWEDRLGRAQNLLAYFPSGLNADSLAGMLGLEAGTLSPRLERWRQQGRLRSISEGSISLYLGNEVPTETNRDASEGWEAIRQELSLLYQAGAFESGSRVALAFAEQNPSAELKILGARHLAASGRSEVALSLLPTQEEVPEAMRGLFHEVRGRALASLGRLEEALPTLIEAENAYRAAGDSSGLSRIFNQRGWLKKKRGDAEAALGFYAQSVELAAAAQDDYAQGLALLNAGGVHHDRGELETALDFYSRSQVLAERSGHPLLLLKLANNRTNIYYTLGRAAEAESSCYDMLRVAIEGAFAEEQAAALNFLSLLAGQRGESEAQLLYLNQAIALLDQRPGSGLTPQLYFNRGYLHWDDGRYTPAQLDAEAALKAAEESANSFIAAWAGLLIAKVLRDRPKPDLSAAQAALERAASEMRRLELGHLLWEAEYDLGLLAKRRGDLDSARKHFEIARDELRGLLDEIPESRRQSYLRDRKLEKIEEELNRQS